MQRGSRIAQIIGKSKLRSKKVKVLKLDQLRSSHTAVKKEKEEDVFPN